MEHKISKQPTTIIKNKTLIHLYEQKKKNTIDVDFLCWRIIKLKMMTNKNVKHQ